MSSKKKLIVLTYDFPPANGGIARLCSEIAVGMHMYYSSVEVITREMEGPNVYFKPTNFTIKRFLEKRGKLELAIIKYLRRIPKNNVDILCGVWHPEATIAKLAGHKNIYVLGHGTEFLHAQNSFRKYFWINIYSRYILKNVNKVIANSHYTEGLINDISKEIKTEVLPLGVNHKFFKPYPEIKPVNNKLKIATLARVFEFKGYDTIAKAISHLPIDIRKSVEWNIGGTGPYLPELKKLIEKLGIEENVNYIGYIKDELLSDFYNKNDIFILCTKESDDSSAVEGFGLVFLEAQSCGIPVIGTKTGGIPDAIEKNNGGWLIEQNDFLHLSKMLMSYIQNPEILVIEGSKARSRVLEFCTFETYRNKLNIIIGKSGSS